MCLRKKNVFSKVSDLVKGRIGDRDTGVQLHADDCKFVADERVSPGRKPLVPTSDAPEWAIAIEWMEVGYK